MQPYVHAAVGLVLAEAFFPDDLGLQFGVVAASVLPDVPTAVEYVKDVLRKEKPFEKPSRLFFLVQDITHSFVVWAIFALAALLHLVFLPLFVGGFVHILIDWLSHKNEKYKAEDPRWIWPLPWNIYGGLFEYREWSWERTQGLKRFFSPIEVGITIACILIFVLLGIF